MDIELAACLDNIELVAVGFFKISYPLFSFCNSPDFDKIDRVIGSIFFIRSKMGGNNMQMTFRWYGEGNDSITPEMIKQIPGVTGLVWQNSG